MNPEQQAAYLKDPYHCPYCHSEYITAHEFKTDSMTQEVECLVCEKQWTDVFTLTAVEPQNV